MSLLEDFLSTSQTHPHIRARIISDPEFEPHQKHPLAEGWEIAPLRVWPGAPAHQPDNWFMVDTQGKRLYPYVREPESFSQPEQQQHAEGKFDNDGEQSRKRKKTIPPADVGVIDLLSSSEEEEEQPVKRVKKSEGGEEEDVTPQLPLSSVWRLLSVMQEDDFVAMAQQDYSPELVLRMLKSLHQQPEHVREMRVQPDDATVRQVLLDHALWGYFYYRRFLADKYPDPNSQEMRELIKLDKERYRHLVQEPSSEVMAYLGEEPVSESNLWFRIFMYRSLRAQETSEETSPPSAPRVIDVDMDLSEREVWEPSPPQPGGDVDIFPLTPETRSEREEREQRQRRAELEDPKRMVDELENILLQTVRRSLSSDDRLVQWHDGSLSAGMRSHVWQIRPRETEINDIAILPTLSLYPTIEEGRQLYMRVLDGVSGRLLNIDALHRVFEETPRYKQTHLYQELQNFITLASQKTPDPDTNLQIQDDMLRNWYHGIDFNNGIVLLFDDYRDPDDLEELHTSLGGGGGRASPLQRQQPNLNAGRAMGLARTVLTPPDVFLLQPDTEDIVGGQLPEDVWSLLDDELFCVVLKRLGVIYQDMSIDPRDLVLIQFLRNLWWQRRRHGVDQRGDIIDPELVDVMIRDDLPAPRWFTNLFSNPWLLDLDAVLRAEKDYPTLFRRDNDHLTLNRSLSELADVAVTGGGVDSQEVMSRWQEIVLHDSVFPSRTRYESQVAILKQVFPMDEQARRRAWRIDLLCKPVLGIVKNKENAMKARYMFVMDQLRVDDVAVERQDHTARWADALSEEREKQMPQTQVIQTEEEEEEEEFEVEVPSFPSSPQEQEDVNQPTLFPGGDPAQLFQDQTVPEVPDLQKKIEEGRKWFQRQRRRLDQPYREFGKEEYEMFISTLPSVPPELENVPFQQWRISVGEVTPPPEEEKQEQLESPARRPARKRQQVERFEPEDPSARKLDLCARPKSEVFANAINGQVNYYDPSNALVVLFENDAVLKHVLQTQLATIYSGGGLGSLEIRPSEALGGIPGLFTGSGRSYRANELITGYSGKQVRLNDPAYAEELEQSEHLLTVYGTQSKWVVMGVTSDDVLAPGSKPQYAGSLANDAVDLERTLTAAKALEPTRQEDVIIKRVGQVNAEFVPMMTYETYCRIQDGEVTNGAGVHMAMFAIRDIGPQEEIFASYGDGYWKDYVWKILRGEKAPLTTKKHKTSTGKELGQEGGGAGPKKRTSGGAVVKDFVKEGPFVLQKKLTCKPGEEEDFAEVYQRTNRELNVVITEYGGAIWTELYEAFERLGWKWKQVRRGSSNPEEGGSRLLGAILGQWYLDHPDARDLPNDYNLDKAWTQAAQILPRSLPVIADVCLRRNAGISMFDPSMPLGREGLLAAILRWSIQFTATDNKHYHMWTGSVLTSPDVNRALLAFSIQFNRVARRFTLEIELACAEMDWPEFHAAEECVFLMMVRHMLNMYRSFLSSAASRKVLEPQAVIVLHNVRAFGHGASRLIDREIAAMDSEVTKNFEATLDQEVVFNPQFGKAVWTLNTPAWQEVVKKPSKKQQEEAKKD